MLILLIGRLMVEAGGALAGTTAAAAAALAPRSFAHAHFATLDTFAALGYVAALFSLAAAVRSDRGLLAFLLAGVVWGFAMLTKLHGMLVIVPAVVCTVWYLRWRALLSLSVWAGARLITFFLGWPWLWAAPFERFAGFLGTATNRQSLHVYYAGRIWQDVEVP